MKLLKLFDIFKLNLVLLMFKCIKSPSSRLSTYLERQPRLLNHNIRTVHDFYLPQFRINSVKLNYQYQALIHWNSLPENIKNSKTVGRFKKLFIDYTTKSYCEH